MINLIACPYCSHAKIDNNKRKGYCDLSKNEYPNSERLGCSDYKSIFINISSIKIKDKD